MSLRSTGFALPFPILVRRGAARPRLGALRALLRQRRALSALDTHLLEDIGVSSEAARREASRPVWDVPETWRD